MSLSMYLLLEYWVELVAMELLHIKFVFSVSVFYRTVPDLARDCTVYRHDTLFHVSNSTICTIVLPFSIGVIVTLSMTKDSIGNGVISKGLVPIWFNHLKLLQRDIMYPNTDISQCSLLEGIKLSYNTSIKVNTGKIDVFLVCDCLVSEKLYSESHQSCFWE